ncbi:MAG: FAM221A/B family protein [archaeon]|nr:FAM221A/B family protein [archaeon]
MQRINIDNKKIQDINAYLEYTNIVGGDDHGKLMKPEEYEEYKKKVANTRGKNKLYIFWVNSQGFECKAVGPYSMCFCNHRLNMHDLDSSITNKKVKCKDSRCKCKKFDYVPVYGANDVKCLCHHSYREHVLTGTRKCTHNNCKCQKFNSKFTCNCGEGYDTHKTVIQNTEERKAEGKPVEAGWFGENLMAGGVPNVGQGMSDVYEAEFQALQKPASEPKVMYSQGKAVIPNKPGVKKTNTSGSNFDNVPKTNKPTVKKTAFDNQYNNYGNYDDRPIRSKPSDYGQGNMGNYGNYDDRPIRSQPPKYEDYGEGNYDERQIKSQPYGYDEGNYDNYDNKPIKSNYKGYNPSNMGNYDNYDDRPIKSNYQGYGQNDSDNFGNYDDRPIKSNYQGYNPSGMSNMGGSNMRNNFGNSDPDNYVVGNRNPNYFKSSAPTSNTNPRSHVPQYAYTGGYKKNANYGGYGNY